MAEQQRLSIQDRFEIFEELNKHQRRIDMPWGCEAAEAYIALYWPEGRFVLNDLRHTIFNGPQGLKQMFDYAHSVFPLDKWFHSMGCFEIEGEGTKATAKWRWFVNWKAEQQGVVSTGTYNDMFEKRNGVWKCIERISDVDPNWPAGVFQPWVDRGNETFKAS